MNNIKSVSDVVKDGNYLNSLIAMRDKLAADMDSSQTPPAIRAQVAKQLQAILVAIEEVPDPDKNKGTVLDDLLNGDDA